MRKTKSKIPIGALVRTAFIQEAYPELGDDWLAPDVIDEAEFELADLWDCYVGASAYKSFEEIKKSVDEGLYNFTSIPPSTPGVLISAKPYKGKLYYKILFDRNYWIKSNEIVEIRMI